MKKFKLFVFNAIIIGISAICIVGFMFASFWRITLTVPLNEESAGKFFGSQAEGIDLSMLPDDIEFTLKIELTPAMLRKTISAKNDEEKARALIEPAVDELLPQVNVAMKALVSTVVKMGVNTALAELENSLGEQSKDKIKDVDLEDVSEIMDKAFQGDLHNEEARDKILELLEGKIEEMEIPQEDKDAAKSAIDENLDGMFEEYFESVTDEKGYINPERTIEMMFTELLELEEGSFNKNALTDKIIETAPKSALNGISIALTVLTVVWIVSAVAWLLLLVFALLALLRGRGTKLWAPCTFAWIPGILLCVLPMIALALVKKMLAESAAIFALFKISFMSVSGVLSLLGICALIVLCILGYRRTRKAVNKELKANK